MTVVMLNKKCQQVLIVCITVYIPTVNDDICVDMESKMPF